MVKQRKIFFIHNNLYGEFFIPLIQTIYYSAKEHNIIAGIALFSLITFIAYLVSARVSLIYYGDIHILFGAVVGIYFAIKNAKSTQPPIKYSLLVGVIGATLTTLSLSLFEWILSIAQFGLNFILFLSFLIEYSLTSFLLGLIVALIIGLYFKNKRNKNKSSDIDEALLRTGIANRLNN